MKNIAVISFGDSAKYRLPVDEGARQDEKLIEEDVRNYLKGRFPQLSSLPFYSKMKVQTVSEEVAAEYPVFDQNALESIENTLTTEVKDARSLDQLNSDAPFSDINS